MRNRPPALSRLNEFICILSSIIPGTYHAIIRNELGSKPKTILDVGCGNGTFMYIAGRNRPYMVTGVDIFDPSIKSAKRTGVYRKVIKMDIRHMMFKKHSFDIVLSAFVLEHVRKREGLRLLQHMESVAKEKVVLIVPMGECEQHAYEGNLHQEHVSQWYAKDFISRGYRVVGQGLNIYDRNPFLKKLLVSIGPLNNIFFFIHTLFQPFISKRYDIVRHLICIKEL